MLPVKYLNQKLNIYQEDIFGDYDEILIRC